MGHARNRVTAVVAILAPLAIVLAGCVPKNSEDIGEVGEARERSPEPPAFPETGEVPPELLIEGLVFDLTNADADLDLWVPTTSEARCAAEKIVENHGKRLSDLGYEPGRTGAGINDIALRPEERESVSGLLQSCVDSVEAIASLFMGGGHMSSEEALCMARGLDDAGMAPVLFDSFMLGAAVDPLDEDGALAEAILEYTDVCLPNTVFTWFGFDLPGSEDLEESDTESDSVEDLPGSAGNITTTTEGRPTGGQAG